MATVPSTLLVLGGPDSGKSTYRAQLYQRVEHDEEGELRLVESVGDLSALQGDVERLVQGLQPMHTKLDIYNSTTLVVEDRVKNRLSLEFADYDGEQMRRIGESNVVPAPWVERAQQSSGWLVFVRIDQIRAMKSFMTDPVETESASSAGKESIPSERFAEIDAIEILQRLVFVRGVSLRHPLVSPRLGILLSCWDELPELERQQSPAALLERRAPLFSSFVASNWEPDQYKIWGLSSTGRKLPEDKPDEEFARTGPERAGYITLPEGNTSPDLTIPLHWLMQPD